MALAGSRLSQDGCKLFMRVWIQGKALKSTSFDSRHEAWGVYFFENKLRGW